MTEYLLLLIACAFFAVQFVFQKLFQQRTVEGLSVCLWNQLVCCTVSIVYLMVSYGVPQELTEPAFGYALAYSAAGMICSVATITAMSCGKVAAVGNYCLAGGMIVPFLYGIIALGESADLWKWLGIAVLCLSMVPSMLKKEESRENSSGRGVKFTLWCIVVFLTNGLVSVFSKMHQISPAAIDDNDFVLVSAFIRCAAALGILLILAAVSRKKGGEHPLRQAFWDIGTVPMTGKLFAALIVFAGAYAVCNTLGNLFSLRCMVTMDASLQFPLLSAVVIILTAVFGRIFFREKFGRETVISLILSTVGIALFMAKDALPYFVS